MSWTMVKLSKNRIAIWAASSRGVSRLNGDTMAQTQNSTDLLSTWSSWSRVDTPTPLKDVAAGYSRGLLTLYAVDQANAYHVETGHPYLRWSRPAEPPDRSVDLTGGQQQP